MSNWPVKLEYNGFVANGLSVAGFQAVPEGLLEPQQLQRHIDDVNGEKAWGGRLGMSIPEDGLIAGSRAWRNQAYDQAGHNLTALGRRR